MFVLFLPFLSMCSYFICVCGGPVFGVKLLSQPKHQLLLYKHVNRTKSKCVLSGID